MEVAVYVHVVGTTEVSVVVVEGRVGVVFVFVQAGHVVTTAVVVNVTVLDVKDVMVAVPLVKVVREVGHDV